MKTWLFTWNPNRWPWDGPVEGYNDLRRKIGEGIQAITTWSCGVNKSIEAGDRIFLIRLGVKQRGIVASGYALSRVFEGDHWDVKLAVAGKKVRRVYIQFDKIVDIDAGRILPYEKLQDMDSSYNWSPQGSGVTIPQDTARIVERYWKMVGNSDIF